jgi:hypothetical protein
MTERDFLGSSAVLWSIAVLVALQLAFTYAPADAVSLSHRGTGCVDMAANFRIRGNALSAG